LALRFSFPIGGTVTIEGEEFVALLQEKSTIAFSFGLQDNDCESLKDWFGLWPK
jgi:hypothetical protein